MKNPRAIETMRDGASFKVPTYQMTNDGIEDCDPVIIKFCKGDKSNPATFRQRGLFTETLLQAAKQY